VVEVAADVTAAMAAVEAVAALMVDLGMRQTVCRR
jgi:hypothetical protein